MEPDKKDHSIADRPEASLSVAFILLPEFTLFAFSGFVDALRIAGDKADDSQQKECRWTVIAPTLQPVRANCGIEIMPWEVFPDPAGYDYVVVIGGRVEPQRSVDPKILAYLRRAANQGSSIVGVCTASFVLARAGLMQNRKCCVHWIHGPEFEEEFPDIEIESGTIFLEDRDRITCSGGRSAADVALYLIEKHCGAASARKAATGMVIEEMRGHQAPQPHSEASWYGDIGNPLVRCSINVMDRFLTDRLSMREVAKRLQVSENTLYRSFNKTIGVSPAKLYRLMRLANGHWGLHHTSSSISEIAYCYGFSDVSHFTLLHGQYYGMTPAKARDIGERDCVEMMETLQPDGIIRQLLAGGLFIFS